MLNYPPAIMRSLSITKSSLVISFALLLLCMSTVAAAQHPGAQPNDEGRFTTYEAHPASGPIKIDGILNEPAWGSTTAIKLPFEYLPGDNIAAPVETDFLITFDEKTLYMAFRCYDPDPTQIRAHLMDRDAMETFVQDDHVTVLIDFFNDERRAFQFRVNPLGVQADAIFSELEGYEDFSWDAIWDSRGSFTESGWVVEIAIPFNQLRFPETGAVQTWGIGAERSYPRTVRHRMASHKRERDILSILAQMNKISGFTGMKTGLNLEVAPTVTADRTDERLDFPAGDLHDGDIDVEPGLSVRWGITPSMILNAAVNPDFSQVEADVKQLEVNRRFAIRYAEKRPFFLEGADLFLTPIEAMFTRTVADPDGGFKFTGKSGKNAIGIFATRDRLTNLLLPSNQGSIPLSWEADLSGAVLRFRRDVGQGSTAGILYTGRIGDDYYNHVTGLDAFLRLSKKKTLSVQYLHSETDYTPAIDSTFLQAKNGFRGGAASMSFNHQGSEWGYSLSYQDMAPGFRSDFGYVPRVDLRTGQAALSRDFWGGENSWYDRISVGGYGGATFDYDDNRTDSDIHLYASYQGALQTYFYAISALKREVFADTEYDLVQAMAQLEMKPTSGLRLYMMTHFGDMIDYSNLRLAWHLILNPAVEFNLGKHLNVNLRHRYMQLADGGSEIFTANLSQVNLIYNFNVRTFVRAIVQYQDIANNPDMYIVPVVADEQTVFTQFLFSYKLNPQTVLFAGYSDNHLGYSGIDITQKDRTFFVKLGYAWLQ